MRLALRRNLRPHHADTVPLWLLPPYSSWAYSTTQSIRPASLPPGYLYYPCAILRSSVVP